MPSAQDSRLLTLPWMGGVICAFAWLVKLHYQPVHAPWRAFYMPLLTNSTVLWFNSSLIRIFVLSVSWKQDNYSKSEQNSIHDGPRSIRLGLKNELRVWRKVLERIKVTAHETGLKHGRFDYAGRGYSRKSKTTLHEGDASAWCLTGVPPVAAVCVYQNFVRIAKNALRWFRCKVAAVAAAFPTGMSTKSKIRNKVGGEWRGG